MIVVRWSIFVFLLLCLSPMKIIIAQEITNAPDQLKTFRTLKFSEWSEWPMNYPMCSPTKNAKTSPINIEKSKIVEDHQSQTLFVYSGTPVSSYLVSLNFTAETGYQIDALNIMTVNTAFHEATYVTGLGDVSNRFLEYVLFFFTDKPKVSSQLSTHQINGKGFPMEILMLFSNRRSFDDTTQLHILVNISNVDNPLFVPIVNATKIISERIKNRDKNTKLVEEKRVEKQEIIERLNLQKQKLEAEGTLQLFDKLEDAKQAISDLQSEIEEKRRDIQDTNALLKDEEANIKMYTKELEERKKYWKKKCDDAIRTFENSMSEFMEEESQVSSLSFDEVDTQQIEADDCQNEKNAELESIIQNKKHYEEQAQLSRQSIAELLEEINQKEEEVKDILEELEFETVEDLHDKSDELDKIINPDNEGSDDEARIKKLIAEIKYLETELKFEHQLPHFQVSWLFPPIGGHYLYDGSLPIPPCTKRGYTFVFENPISISKEQFKIISSIPKAKDAEPLNQCLPVLSGVNKRIVRYSKKNPQFILDDSKNMKSKLRKALKDIKNIGPILIHYNFLIIFRVIYELLLITRLVYILLK